MDATLRAIPSEMTTPSIPSQAQALWAHLDYETMHVHAKWLIYRQLFGTSADRYDLLMRAASRAFSMIEQAMLDDVQLTVAKLVDRSKNTATLHALQKILHARDDPSWVRSDLAPKIAALGEKCAAVTARRNDWIAHFGAAAVAGEPLAPRMNPARQEIEDALAALRNAMNAVHQRYRGNPTAYEHTYLVEDGDALIEVVRRGLLVEDLVEQGKLSWQLLVDR